MGKIIRRLRFLLNVRKSIPFIIEYFLSRQVPWSTKGFSLLLILGYFALPFDIIPDFLVFFGLVDDLAIVGWILQHIVKSAPPELKAKYHFKEEDKRYS